MPSHTDKERKKQRARRAIKVAPKKKAIAKKAVVRKKR